MYLMHLDLSDGRHYTTNPPCLPTEIQAICDEILNSNADRPYQIFPEVDIYVKKQISKYVLFQMAHQNPLLGSLKAAVCRHSYGKPPVQVWLNENRAMPDSLPFTARKLHTDGNLPDWYAQHRAEIDRLMDALAWHWINNKKRKS